MKDVVSEPKSSQLSTMVEGSSVVHRSRLDEIARLVAREFDIFGGLDVDKKRIAITLMSHQGILRSFSMPHRAEHLLSYVGKHFGGKKIAFAYEASPKGWGLYDS
jgi:hypothetical protein